MNIDDECWGVIWPTRISSRYHARRQAFFETWSRVTAAVGVVFGSSAVATAIAQVHTPTWLLTVSGVIMTIAATVDLIVGTAAMARRHDDLRKRFMQLEARIETTTTPTEADVAGWRAERIAIELDEPPRYVGLALLCENELGRATQGVGPRTKVRWIVSTTAHWFRWPNEHALPV